MSIQPAKTPNEEPSPVLERQPPGYVERGVRWIARKALHLKLPTVEQLQNDELIDRINKKMLCPVVLFRQFQRHIVQSQCIKIYVELGKECPFSYKERVWNWIFRDEAEIKRRHLEIGKSRVRKDPYLLAPSLIKALSNPDDWRSCQCSALIPKNQSQ